MKRGVCNLFIFEPKSDYVKRNPTYVKQAIEVTRMVLRNFATQPISVPAISAYFEYLYNLQDPNILIWLQTDHGMFWEYRWQFKFETAAHLFRIIENVIETVLIPFNKPHWTWWKN